jgi:hypothetical protein
MRVLRFITIAGAMLVSASAYAFSVDNASGQGNSASRFSDPDDRVPFPHQGDNGAVDFQGQPIGDSGATFSFSSHSQSDTMNGFDRAQQRMQQ